MWARSCYTVRQEISLNDECAHFNIANLFLSLSLFSPRNHFELRSGKSNRELWRSCMRRKARNRDRKILFTDINSRSWNCVTSVARHTIVISFYAAAQANEIEISYARLRYQMKIESFRKSLPSVVIPTWTCLPMIFVYALGRWRKVAKLFVKEKCNMLRRVLPLWNVPCCGNFIAQNSHSFPLCKKTSFSPALSIAIAFLCT